MPELLKFCLMVLKKKWAENANLNLKDHNISIKKYDELNLSQSINKHLQECGIHKIRKDAVKAVEILCTASPEYFNGNEIDDKLMAFCGHAKEFINEQYGAENLISTDIHLDEKTPHIHFVVVPITKDGKLSAKTVCGNRKDYQKLQDDFSEKMKDLGLQRGIKGSTAKHIEMKEFYGYLKTDLAPINEFIDRRKNEAEMQYKDAALKYYKMANNAQLFLEQMNLTIDSKTNVVRKLTSEELESKQKKNQQKI